MLFLAAEYNYEIFSVRNVSAHVSPAEAAIRWWQQRGAAQLPSEFWKGWGVLCELFQSSPSTGITENFNHTINSTNMLQAAESSTL